MAERSKRLNRRHGFFILGRAVRKLGVNFKRGLLNTITHLNAGELFKLRGERFELIKVHGAPRRRRVPAKVGEKFRAVGQALVQIKSVWRATRTFPATITGAEQHHGAHKFLGKSARGQTKNARIPTFVSHGDGATIRGVQRRGHSFVARHANHVLGVQFALLI